MNNELDARQSLVQNFIDKVNSERSAIAQKNEFESSPDVKFRKLDGEYNKSKSVCINHILGKIMRGALPFDDPHKNCSDDQAASEVNDFISARTNGRNSEYYVREAIKKNGSKCLNQILTEANRISKKFYTEKAQNINTINIKDLNFDPNQYTDDFNRSLRNIDAEELSDIIASNVKQALNDESDKIKRENDYSKMIEDKLAQDDSVVDDASMESAMSKLNVNTQPTFYQPSLFEGIILGKTKHMTESSMDEIMSEAILEYTKLSMVKALRLERFTLESVKDLANSYLK